MCSRKDVIYTCNHTKKGFEYRCELGVKKIMGVKNQIRNCPDFNNQQKHECVPCPNCEMEFKRGLTNSMRWLGVSSSRSSSSRNNDKNGCRSSQVSSQTSSRESSSSSSNRTRFTRRHSRSAGITEDTAYTADTDFTQYDETIKAMTNFVQARAMRNVDRAWAELPEITVTATSPTTPPSTTCSGRVEATWQLPTATAMPVRRVQANLVDIPSPRASAIGGRSRPGSTAAATASRPTKPASSSTTTQPYSRNGFGVESSLDAMIAAHQAQKRQSGMSPRVNLEEDDGGSGDEMPNFGKSTKRDSLWMNTAKDPVETGSVISFVSSFKGSGLKRSDSLFLTGGGQRDGNSSKSLRQREAVALPAEILCPGGKYAALPTGMDDRAFLPSTAAAADAVAAAEPAPPPARQLSRSGAISRRGRKREQRGNEEKIIQQQQPTGPSNVALEYAQLCADIKTRLDAEREGMGKAHSVAYTGLMSGENYLASHPLRCTMPDQASREDSSSSILDFKPYRPRSDAASIPRQAPGPAGQADHADAATQTGKGVVGQKKVPAAAGSTAASSRIPRPAKPEPAPAPTIPAAPASTATSRPKQGGRDMGGFYVPRRPRPTVIGDGDGDVGTPTPRQPRRLRKNIRDGGERLRSRRSGGGGMGE